MARRVTHQQLQDRLASVADRLGLTVGNRPGDLSLDRAPGGGYRVVVMCESSGEDTGTFGHITLSASQMSDALDLIAYSLRYAERRAAHAADEGV